MMTFRLKTWLWKGSIRGSNAVTGSDEAEGRSGRALEVIIILKSIIKCTGSKRINPWSQDKNNVILQFALVLNLELDLI